MSETNQARRSQRNVRWLNILSFEQRQRNSEKIAETFRNAPCYPYGCPFATHAARNIRAQQTFEVTNSVEAAQASLGHKSPKSTQSYLKPKRRGARVLRGIEQEVSGTLDSIEVTRTGVIRNRRRINN